MNACTVFYKTQLPQEKHFSWKPILTDEIKIIFVRNKIDKF